MRIWQAGKKRQAITIQPFNMSEAINHAFKDGKKLGLSDRLALKFAQGLWDISEAFPNGKPLMRTDYQ